MKNIKIKSSYAARPEDVRICYLCGKDIIGDYDYLKTKRGLELYFHKGMKCRDGKDNEANR